MGAKNVGTMKRGRFITFEGGEGAGKSTQVRRLAGSLRASGVDVVTTREPGGTPRAEDIRDFLLAGHAQALGPMAEALLFSAARIDHVDKLITPALERGAWVICDRFADSTRAYQGALGQLDADTIDMLEQTVLGELRPDLTIVLDVPPKVGLDRARARRMAGVAPDRFEAEGPTFHLKLRNAFRAIVEANPERCVLVRADSPEEEVEAAVALAVAERFGAFDEQPTPAPKRPATRARKPRNG